MDRNKLPVEIMENEMPKDNMKYDDSFETSPKKLNAGFADLIFLGAIMAICLMWGMLIVIVK